MWGRKEINLELKGKEDGDVGRREQMASNIDTTKWKLLLGWRSIFNPKNQFGNLDIHFL